jgi:hypothetical protein
MNLQRKYVGIPSQEEIIQQYNEITTMTKNILTIEQMLNFQRTHYSKGMLINIEINYEHIDKYKSEPIDIIRYEYKNILVYAKINNGNVEHIKTITLYNDKGSLQFADALYNEYDKEIERVATMGLLTSVL